MLLHNCHHGVLAVLTLLVGACSAEHTRATAIPSATSTGTLAISSTPTLDISANGDTGQVQMERITGATRLSGGRLAVADRGASNISFFDSLGHRLRVVGRRGSGPGEFRDLVSISQCAPDTLFAWDRMHARMTVLDSAGNYLKDMRVPGDPVQISCDRSGILAILSMAANSSMADPVVRGAIILSTPEGDSLRSLLPITLATNRPLGPKTSIAMAHDVLYVGTAESSFVATYGSDGRRLGSVPLELTRLRATQATYDAAIDELVSALREAASRAHSKKLLESTPMPEYLPAYRRILAGPGGSLWVVVSPLGEDKTDIKAWSAGGHPLTTIHLPHDVDVFEVGADYILGAYSDSASVPHLAMYKLTRRH